MLETNMTINPEKSVEREIIVQARNREQLFFLG